MESSWEINYDDDDNASNIQNGLETKEINDAMTLINTMTPLELSFMIMMYNMVIGWVCSIFIAALTKLKQKK